MSGRSRQYEYPGLSANDYSSLPALYSADLTASLELTSFAKQNKNLSGLYVIGSNQLELKSTNISFLKKTFR